MQGGDRLVADDHGPAARQGGDPRAGLSQKPAPNHDLIGGETGPADGDHGHRLASCGLAAPGTIRVFRALMMASTASEWAPLPESTVRWACS